MNPADFPTQAILELWFGDTFEQPEHIDAVKRRWFAGGPALDAQLRESYGRWLRPVACATDWQGAATERLARIIVLDQFSRNIHRGTAEAFVFDAAARILMRAGLEQEQDSELPPVGCCFFYMPLQHAETLELQTESVRRFGDLVGRARCDAERDSLQGNLRFAKLHADIIQRFGRFPHRNQVLGRESTAEETEYLSGNAPHFGQ